MNIFLGYMACITDLAARKDRLVTSLVDYFDPNDDENYYIMDPYLDVIQSIREPFRTNRLDEKIWSNLIGALAANKTSFKIITREPRGGYLSTASLPYVIKYPEPTIQVSIEVCKYTDTKYNNLSLHDRYILKESKASNKGVHIGPSLEDINDKDVSITSYSTATTETAIQNFKNLWEQCIKYKEWRRG